MLIANSPRVLRSQSEALPKFPRSEHSVTGNSHMLQNSFKNIVVKHLTIRVLTSNNI